LAEEEKLKRPTVFCCHLFSRVQHALASSSVYWTEWLTIYFLSLTLSSHFVAGREGKDPRRRQPKILELFLYILFTGIADIRTT
jgi:hypothetical protein